MKPLFTFLSVILLSWTLHAQTQRMVLFEEFTSASCSWCAYFNPAFQTLLNNNSTKCTAIKYQSNFGYDPMFDHNPAESNARGTYYGVPGYPDCVMDGNQFHGSPGQVTQTMINNRFAITSPLQITINQELSAGQDSIYVTALIKATQACSGNLIAHLVVIEKHIHFNTAPGTNGEKDFYNVMKKMLPGSGGTQLPASMEPGDYVLIREAWKLANVYKLSELSVVGFVQNNTSKEILQAANTTSTQIVALYDNDAQASNISGLLDKYCINHISPIVKFRNNGNTALTNAEIRYKVNNSDESIYHWTGNLEFLEEEQIALPEIDFPLQDNNSLAVYITMPNNTSDEYSKNDTLIFGFTDAVQALSTVKVLVRTDTHPEETTWEIKDQNGVVFASGGPYSQPNKIYSVLLTPVNNVCYDFFIYDSGGDGIVNGFYSVYSPAEPNDLILGGGSMTGSEKRFQFFGPTGVDNNHLKKDSKLLVTPNPADAVTTAAVILNANAVVEVNIADISGKTVKTISHINCKAGLNEIVLDVKNISQGLYILKLKSDTGEVFSTKLIIQ